MQSAIQMAMKMAQRGAPMAAKLGQKVAPKLVGLVGNLQKRGMGTLMKVADKTKYAGKYRGDVEFALKNLLKGK